ncbi:MAG: efflux RND transporter periplasmic adaptor subunit [Gammaproteobacteria bacterium]|jgi:membrane fusion protein (multidrug efflux system)
MNTSIRRLMTAGTLFALGALAGCGHGGNQDAKADQDKAPPLPVETAVVSRGDVQAYYSGTTTLEAENEAAVVARVDGTVEKILVEEGDHVKAGQVLAVLDDDQLRLQYQKAEANLGKTEQEFRRNQELHQKHLVSADAFEKLRYELASLKAERDLAKLQLEYTRIRAPIDGVISKRDIKVGNTVTANQATFHITDFDPLLAKLHVPEQQITRLADGQPARVHVDALPDTSFQGHVLRMSPVVDPQTGTFEVTVAVKDAGMHLKPGMFGRVQIIYDVRHNALLVPRNAVVTEDAESSVYVIKDGVARRQVVSTGYTTDGRIEVTSGVKEGDQVVTVGQSTLKDGARVAIVQSTDKQAQVARSDG